MTLTKPPIFDVKADTFDKKIVQAAFHEHGAVILSNLDHGDDGDAANWAEIAASVPHLMFDSDQLLLSNHRADAVHLEHERIGLQGHPLLPHSDGYIWGDRYPDLVLLVCEQPAVADTTDTATATTTTTTEGSGANFLLDGYSIISKLKEKTRKLLETTLVDHTEYSDTSFAAGTKSIVPVLRYRDHKQQQQDTESSSSSPSWWKEAAEKNANKDNVKSMMIPSPTKRLCWRRMIHKDHAKITKEKSSSEVDTKPPYISLWTPVRNEDNKEGDTADDSEDTTLIQDALYELDLVIGEEAKIAQRFTLQRGQAIIVDNYRMLHARDDFMDFTNTRRMWRVWSWSNESMGLPHEMEKHLTTTNTNGTLEASTSGTAGINLPPAGILEAEQTIKAHG